MATAIRQLPARLPLSLSAGDDFAFTLTVTENGTPYVWTGATVEAVLVGYTVASFSADTSTAGTLILSLTDAQTATAGIFGWYLRVTKAGGSRTWCAGTVHVSPATDGGTSSSSATLAITTAGSVALAITVGAAGPAGPTGPVDTTTAAALTAHIDDTTDAHDASAVSVADAGGYYTGTTVETVLAELAALTPPVGAAARLVPMASNCAPSFQSGNAISDGVLTGGTARMNHVALCTASGLRLVFSNHYASGSFVEESGPNVITVKASVEHPSTYMFPVTFNGADSVEIAPGANVTSDPIGLEIAKGTTFYTRTYVAVGAGQFFPRGGIATASSGTTSWHNYAYPAGLDLTGVGAAAATSGYSEYTFSPSAILGTPAAVGPAVVGVVGDSIAAGTGDFQNGWVQRWLASNYPFQRVAYPGEGVGTGWMANQGRNRYRRYALLNVAGASRVIAEHIVNDLGTTYATLQSNMLSYWTNLSRLGRVWAVTCTPQTTSTDSWATLGNQTVMNGSKETTRLSFNEWLRAGAPTVDGVAVAAGTNGALVAGASGHPLTGYLEIADLVESARDSGKWRVDLGAPTTDGTHPSAVIAAAVAAGLPSPSLYFGAVAT